MMSKPLSLYIHIPFCVRKCHYCDFLSAPGNTTVVEKYIAALLKEIESYAPKIQDYQINTVFIGGGTPSLLTPEQVKRLTDAVKALAGGILHNIEFTIEANPGTVDDEKLSTYVENGVNRISFGLQSMYPELLQKLGRIHSYEDFLTCYGQARKAGFQNINVDLISGIPGLTLSMWQETLKEVLQMAPEHISAYSLIVEEGTPFYKWEQEGKLKLPSEEEELQMDISTREILTEGGYSRYEISNYSRSGFACKHNLAYWRLQDYLGVGLGAASYFEGERFRGTDSLEVYLTAIENSVFPKQECHKLTETERMEEFMFLGLRTVQGISTDIFFEMFGKPYEDIYGDITASLERKNLLARKGTYIFLTERGMDVSNPVLAEFLRNTV